MSTKINYYANIQGHGPTAYAWCRMAVHGHGGNASITLTNTDAIHGNGAVMHYRADGIVFADGTLQTTAASHGSGGGSYDQSLNTTDAPTFAGLSLPTGSINLHGGNINFYTSNHGITFSDGSSLTSAAGLNGLPAPQGNGGALLYSTPLHGWQQTHGWMQVGPTAAHGSDGAHHSANILVSTDGATRTYYQSNGIRFADGTFQSTAAAGGHGGGHGGGSPYMISSGFASIVTVEGVNVAHGQYATIAGGYSNSIGSGGTNSFIGGGTNNYINAAHSSIIGGGSNSIAHGVNNHIIGSNITAGHGMTDTTFVNNFSIVNGGLMIFNIPTIDPQVAGQVWSHGGILKMSASV